jgi:GNAT superfamily N-acetyltransferase
MAKLKVADFLTCRGQKLRRSVAAVLRRVVRRRWVVTFEQWVPPDAPPPTAVPPGLSIRRGTVDDAETMRPLLRGNEPIERRFARGDTVLVAELDGLLVGCQWISDGPMTVEYFRLRVAPRPGARYCYGFYVLPDARRHGVGRALEGALLLEAEQTDTRGYWCHVDGFNRRSLVVHRSIGWRPVEASRGLVLLNRFGVTLWRKTWPNVPSAASS